MKELPSHSRAAHHVPAWCTGAALGGHVGVLGLLPGTHGNAVPCHFYTFCTSSSKCRHRHRLLALVVPWVSPAAAVWGCSPSGLAALQDSCWGAHLAFGQSLFFPMGWDFRWVLLHTAGLSVQTSQCVRDGAPLAKTTAAESRERASSFCTKHPTRYIA